MMDFLQAREYFSIYQSMPAVAADIVQTIYTHKKYVNIPSEKYVYIHTYVKWMSAGLMPACHKNG